MGKFVNNIDGFFEYCEANEVEFVDFRFTDIKGAWHHISYRMSAVTPEMLEAGLPFDGSSIENWQPINKSDMLLKPDIPTAFLDPFTADSTIIVICDVYDIYKNDLYERCPRSIAKKTLKYMEESGIGDEVFFGPENEFFIFDNVQIWSGINESGYRVDSEEGEWSASTSYGEVGNMGHRPGTKVVTSQLCRQTLWLISVQR
jgi:glutamine synthetase